MSFKELFDTYQWEDVEKSITAKTARDVEIALAKDRCDLEDFKALISPAALPYLEQMAQKSHQNTLRRFGKTMQLYVPLYLSNKCHNSCVYCGFSVKNKIHRRVLTDSEIMQEVEVIKGMGFEHLLLVTGESPREVGVDYLKNAIRLLRPHFAQITCEVQPMDQADYETLAAEGMHGVYVYQETFNKDRYPEYHPAGKKADFYYRLETPERLGHAGVHKVGLGALIGLEEWRTELFFLAMHLNYLEKKFWQTKYSISFPRMRPFTGGFQPNVIMSDRELVQAICAFRLFDNEVELSISTRESAAFRDNLVKLGVTAMSAGSKTNPGGYAVSPETLEQFNINDDRTPVEICEMLRSKGYEAVWKDWDISMIALES
ncbi:2-iminoacetate synthase ThiH [Parabacteroides sp. FAFU027]|uniref:2-iminoacetate synthase ThiH n=1 Tax=Parabacteroides sp. FAFU027 TaxID=2922715 RepID=UPI001FAE988E|nr:2-iminoacetate synthase ThiH [Parabacteroides sp. FAFU027]